MLSRKALVVVAIISALAMFGACLARAADLHSCNKAATYDVPPVFAWTGLYAYGKPSFSGMPNPLASRNGGSHVFATKKTELETSYWFEIIPIRDQNL